MTAAGPAALFHSCSLAAWLIVFPHPSSIATAAEERIRILDEQVDSFQARIELIDSATHTLDLAYYSWKRDESGMRVFRAIKEAADRGVRIRFVIDGISSLLPPEAWQWMEEEPGIAFRFFQPRRLGTTGNLHYRLHDKLIIADSRRVITGGRNIGNDYFDPQFSLPYADRDVLWEGGAVQHAADYYDLLWSRSNTLTRSEWLRGSFTTPTTQGNVAAWSQGQAREDWRRKREMFGGDAEQAKMPAFARVEAARSRWHSVAEGNIRFVHDHFPKTDPDNHTSATELYQLFQSARRELVVQSPYVIPTRRLLNVISGLRNRGVRIVVYTNNLSSTRNLLAQAGMIETEEELLRAGVEILKYSGPRSMHAKSFVIDRRIGIVGSFNLDPRSEMLNTESFVAVESESFAKELLLHIRRHEVGYHAVSAGQSKSLSGMLVVDPEAGLKNFPMPLLRALSPLYRKRL